MKKILLIRANKTKFGGAEIYLSRLANQLQEDNIECEIVNSIFPNFLPSWLRVLLFNLQICLRKKDGLYFSLDRISCPDIYRSGDGVHKKFLSIEKKSKFNLLHPIYLFIENRTYKNAHRIIAISNMVKKDIISSYDVDPDKIHVVYNGINLKEVNYESSSTKIKAEFDIKLEEKVILFVGSGFKRKGVDEFIQIINELRDYKFKAFIIGKDKNLSFYKHKISTLKLDHKIIFTGPREDVSDFFTIADLFLFPTHYEPFGNVVLEAMHHENVVITTRQCGASELLKQKYIMGHPKDFSIIPTIKELFENQEILKKNKKFNQKIALNFGIAENAKQTLKIIEEII